jgi:hypothetical protein
MINKHNRGSANPGKSRTAEHVFRYHFRPCPSCLTTMDAGLSARSNGLIKYMLHIRTGLTTLLAIQLGAILFPYACLLAFPYVVHRLNAYIHSLYKYFSPDFETALKNGYTRPIIGLRLCRRCQLLRYTPQDRRVQHIDNAAQLKVSGSEGCWLCHAVNEQFRQSQADFENPPKHHRPDDLRTHHLLLWFAERTETSSGFLDHLRGKSMSPAQTPISIGY